MKTIEQAAKVISNKNGNSEAKGLIQSTYDTGVYEGFKAGVEFAQRWRDPKTEKPETEQLVQVKLNIIVTNNNHIGYDHDKFNIQHDIFEIEQQCCIEVIGWRPINIK